MDITKGLGAHALCIDTECCVPCRSRHATHSCLPESANGQARNRPGPIVHSSSQIAAWRPLTVMVKCRSRCSVRSEIHRSHSKLGRPLLHINDWVTRLGRAAVFISSCTCASAALCDKISFRNILRLLGRAGHCEKEKKKLLIQIAPKNG